MARIDVAQLHEGLVKAFDLQSLDRMLTLKMGVRLEEIAKPADLRSAVFDVIKHFQQNDRLSKLLITAHRTRPNNITPHAHPIQPFAHIMPFAPSVRDESHTYTRKTH